MQQGRVNCFRHHVADDEVRVRCPKVAGIALHSLTERNSNGPESAGITRQMVANCRTHFESRDTLAKDRKRTCAGAKRHTCPKLVRIAVVIDVARRKSLFAQLDRILRRLGRGLCGCCRVLCLRGLEKAA